MKILFLANGPFAVPVLAALRRENHAIDLVIRPDPPKGRRGAAVVPPARRWAEAEGVPFRRVEDLADPAFLESVRAERFPVGFAVDYGRKVPKALFELPAAGIWNLHPSLLPRWRGASPVPWTILEEDAETGVTLFRIVEKMDAGPILLARRLRVEPEESAPELLARLSGSAADLALSGLSALAAGALRETAQEEAQATHARKLAKEDGRIDWREPAERILRRVRALAPWPGAFTIWTHPRKGPTTLFIERARPAGGADLPPGEVAVARGAIRIGTGTDPIEVARLKPAGGESMPADAFLRGYPMKNGDRLA